MSDKEKKVNGNEQQLIPVEADEKGVLVPKTLESQWRLAKYFSESGLLPKDFNTPAKVLVGMQYSFELGLKPLVAMQNIAIINGRCNIWGDLPLAIVRMSNLLESIDEFFLDKNGKKICMKNDNLLSEVAAAVCVAKRKGEEPKTAVFTVEDAKTAGLWGQNVWKKYPKDMLKYKPRSRLLKDMFPDVLKGLAIMEHEHNTNPDLDPGNKTALNQTFDNTQSVDSDLTNHFLSKEDKAEAIEIPKEERGDLHHGSDPEVKRKAAEELTPSKGLYGGGKATAENKEITKEEQILYSFKEKYPTASGYADDIYSMYSNDPDKLHKTYCDFADLMEKAKLEPKTAFNKLFPNGEIPLV